MRILLVCLGGALGSGARYLVADWVGARVGTGFPWGTLSVNVIGCFLIEVVLVLGARPAGLSPIATLTLTTGFLGGFTTYSAFDNQLLGCVREGTFIRALTYAGATGIGCLAAGALGLLVGRGIAGQGS